MQRRKPLPLPAADVGDYESFRLRRLQKREPPSTPEVKVVGAPLEREVTTSPRFRAIFLDAALVDKPRQPSSPYATWLTLVAVLTVIGVLILATVLRK